MMRKITDRRCSWQMWSYIYSFLYLNRMLFGWSTYEGWCWRDI